MADTAADRAAAVQQVLDATANTDSGVQQAALEAMIPPPGPDAANSLWRILVLGILILMAIALIGLLYTVVDGDADTSPDLIIAVFSSLLAGLLGLFVTSPVNDGTDG